MADPWFYVSGNYSNDPNITTTSLQKLNTITGELITLAESLNTTDIAFHPDGRLFGCIGNIIYELDTSGYLFPANPKKIIASDLFDCYFSGMTIDKNGLIWLIGHNSSHRAIFTFDLSTNELKTIGTFPKIKSYLDIEWYNGKLYAIGRSSITSEYQIMITHIDLSNFDNSIDYLLGKIPESWGLASINTECESINLIATNGVNYWEPSGYNLFNENADNFTFVSVPNMCFATGATSRTSYLGSYTPLAFDSVLISQHKICDPQYSITASIKKGYFMRPDIKYSLDGIFFQSDSTFSDLAPGRYVVHMKDSLGCYKMSDTIVLKERQVVSLQSNKTTCGNDNGQLIINKQDPTLNYSVSIDGSIFSTTDSIPNLSSGAHQVIIEYENGCRDTSIVMIEAEPLPDFSNAQIIEDNYCDRNNGSAHIVSSDLNNGIFYSFDGINYTKDSINLNNLIGGNYPVYLRHETGCLDTINFEIKSFPPSEIHSINITPANCNASDGIISITSSQLNDEIKLNGVISSTGIFDQLSQGNYTIEIKNNFGCITDSIAFVPGKNVPVIEYITANDAHCNENNGSIFVKSSQSTDQYSLDGINYQSINSFDSLTNGKYDIYIRNIEGCIEKRNAEIIQTGLPLIDSLTTTDESCDQHNGAVRIYTSGNEVINYSLNNSINSNNSTFDDLKSGIYTITIMDAFGCEQFAYFTLQNKGAIKEISSIEIKRGDCNNALAQVFLPNNTPDKYSITGQTSNPDGSYSLTPGKYTILIENELCAKDTTITVLPANCEPFVPNVFSPNDDGVNDVFRIEGAGFEILDFRVFNRWGALFFSALNNNGWDGRYKGKMADIGVYTYFIELKIGDEKRILKGDVTVIR